VVSWSGGKDSCLAAYRSMQDGCEVAYLLNCARQEYKRSSGHGVRAELTALQARAMGIPLHQSWVTRDDYEKRFKEALGKLKKEGVTAVVTGDVYLEDSRNWMLKVCGEAGIGTIMPLWSKNSKDILNDFITAGFEAVVVCVKADLLGKEWLGRKIDFDFIRDLPTANPSVDLCGEMGEFHTFVVDGPLFKKRVRVCQGEKVLREGYWFLDLKADF
jgi:uncharacterized protein (TIGR00290 family)